MDFNILQRTYTGLNEIKENSLNKTPVIYFSTILFDWSVSVENNVLAFKYIERRRKKSLIFLKRNEFVRICQEREEIKFTTRTKKPHKKANGNRGIRKKDIYVIDYIQNYFLFYINFIDPFNSFIVFFFVFSL